jgi:hypothetical protein
LGLKAKNFFCKIEIWGVARGVRRWGTQGAHFQYDAQVWMGRMGPMGRMGKKVRAEMQLYFVDGKEVANNPRRSRIIFFREMIESER